MEQFNVGGHSVSVTKGGHDMGDVSHWLHGLREQVAISITTDDGTEYHATYKPVFCFAAGIVSVEPMSLRKGCCGDLDYFAFRCIIVEKEFVLVRPYRRQEGYCQTNRKDETLILFGKTESAK